jgi:ubiquinone/menaquinone biosynthesis C-methylase UbiE
MGKADIEYHGLMAETWDLFRGDTSDWEDRFFFKEMIDRYGQPVLDVGCGTGRLLLDYMAADIDIDGLDISPDMLAICRQKGASLKLEPKLFLGDMVSMNLPRKYQIIIVPSSSFQLVTDLDEASTAMSRLYDQLLAGGVLVMSFMIFKPGSDGKFSEWRLANENTRPEDSALAQFYIRGRNDAETQLQHNESRYEVTLDGEVIASEFHQRSPATRWYTQSQAVDMFVAAGFKDMKLFRGATQEPATADDDVFAVMGTKA